MKSTTTRHHSDHPPWLLSVALLAGAALGCGGPVAIPGDGQGTPPLALDAGQIAADHSPPVADGSGPIDDSGEPVDASHSAADRGEPAADAASASPDASADAGVDASADAGVDAGIDAGIDGGLDPADSGCPAGDDNCQPFSIVLLPDTQYYTSKQDDDVSNSYRKQTRWIRDMRASERIAFAIHLGDITGHNRPEEWAVADHAHAILDQAELPYSVTTGNHDYIRDGAFARSHTLIDDTFPASRFAGKPWYEGPLGSSNASNVTLFEVGARRFMVLSLEYAPRKDTLCRAEQQIAAHPDRRVIVATHCYLSHGASYASNCPDVDYRTVGASGEAVWDELVSRHSNIFLVVSGHIGESAYQPATGHAGNTVHQLVVDYQFEAACSAADASQCSDHCRAGDYTGNGWLRQMIFDPERDELRSRTLSVEAGNPAFFPGGQPTLFCSELNNQGENAYAADPQGPDHQFRFAQDLGPLPPYQRVDGGRHSFIDRTVNSVGTGDQLTPRVAAAASGDFVVVWEDNASAADGAGNHDIVVRGFAAGGCEAFSDRVVNTTTAGQQQTPAVAMDQVGNFVVVWADDRDLNGVYQIHARGFWADGSERFAVFTVNSEAQGQQLNPEVAMAPDGRFTVVWEDAPESDGRYQIRMRGFAADGSERFADRSVHDAVSGVRVAPALGLDADANAVVTWQDDGDGNGVYQIHARGFAADGSPRYARRVVNSVADGQQTAPAIGVAATGDFVVAWEDDPDRDGSAQILARGFDAAGSPRLADFAVPGPPSGQRLAPAIAMQASGDFAVTWQDDSDGNGTSQIHARAFRADGAEWKARWTVNRQAAGQQSAPHAALSGDSLVVSWQDDMDGNGAWQLLARGLDLP